MKGLKWNGRNARQGISAGQGINTRNQQLAVGIEKDIGNRRHPLWPF